MCHIRWCIWLTIKYAPNKKKKKKKKKRRGWGNFEKKKISFISEKLYFGNSHKKFHFENFFLKVNK